MFIAEHLAKKGSSVYIVEKNADFMQRASYANQARVHNGYHYPRSVLTALRSRFSFPRFIDEFRSSIYDQFEKYYMVGKVLGKVTAKQFETFCNRIGAPCEPAPTRITKLTNSNLIEAVYLTTEYAFDAVMLKNLMKDRLDDAGVTVLLDSDVRSVRSLSDGRMSVEISRSDGNLLTLDSFDHVFNCTYSMLNFLNLNSSIDLIPLKHEMTEMCLVEVPGELKNCGVTVMCGPFFSFMPFPSKGYHTFSHVRYTPHYEWMDSEPGKYINGHDHFEKAVKKSSWGAMWRDAARYMPVLEKTQYINSIWEVKTVLPRSESDDSRPILFKPNHGIKGFHCVMGGKIDNVYDAISEIDRIGLVNHG